MILPTQAQAEALKVIRDLSRDGMAPTYEELRLALGLASKGSVHRVLHRLKERGQIDFIPNVARSIRIVGEMEGLEKRSDADLRALRDRINIILNKRAS